MIPLSGVVMLVLAGGVSTAVGAQQPAAIPSLVFDGVTIVDVEHGKLLPAQRVVIAGNRIHAVGERRSVNMPKGAQVVDARGKYLIPGLWDMHIHVESYPHIMFPLFITNGVTGIRDMSTDHLDSLLQLRRAIAAGERVGPRLVTPGPWLGTTRAAEYYGSKVGKDRLKIVASPEEGRRAVDSLRAAGADFIKVRNDLPRDIYFAVAAEARRLGMTLAGHLPFAITAAEASDSGQRSLEHAYHFSEPPEFSLRVGVGDCSASGSNYMRETLPVVVDTAQRRQRLLRWKAAADSIPDVGACVALAEQFMRNGTWITPTLAAGYNTRRTLGDRTSFWPDTVLRMEPERGSKQFPFESVVVAVRGGMPMLMGTDGGSDNPAAIPGFALHDELYLAVVAGMTPLRALQAATLNPAKYFGAMDSLGTVAAGKLADLVLLDADPLADITNTTTIRAVVANGRYFDRVALDQLLSEVQSKAIHRP